MGTFDNHAEERKSFSDFELATRTRDAMKLIAEQHIGPVQQNGQIARVVRVDNVGLKATVWFPGDDAPVDVNLLSHLIPGKSDWDSTTANTSERGWGSRVWVEKINGKSYITAVLSGGTLSSKAGTFENQVYASNPNAGTQGNSYGVQTGSTVSLVVPNPGTDETVGFGPLGGVIAGSFVEMTVKDMRFSTTKTYQFSGLATFNAAFTNEDWYKLPPIRTNAPLDFYTDIGDFDVEIGNTWFISTWDNLPYYMMSIRIRRKDDNNPSAEYEANGYQIIIRSHMGLNTLVNESGFFRFETWFESAAEPDQVYGTTDYSLTLGQPNVGPYESAAMDFPRRIQWGLTGPEGALLFDGTSIKWTGDFLFEGAGAHPHTLTSGYAAISMPASGTAITVIGSSTVTTRNVSATGIQLNPGEALYYKIRMGQDATSDSSRWVIVSDGTKDAQIPPYWIFVALRSGLDTGTNGVMSLRLGTGESLDRWHRIGDAGEPSFTNSWVDYNTGVRRVSFRKEANEVVRLYGMIKSGTVGSGAFTLPVGYRPAGQILCSTMSGNAAGRVDVTAAGVVTPIAPSVNSWVSLDSITFVAEG